MLRTFFRRLLKGDPGPLRVGSKCPTFSALDTQGELVTQDNLAGKRVVLWFFPKASTPG